MSLPLPASPNRTLFLSFSGRLSRRGFWLAQSILLPVAVVLVATDYFIYYLGATGGEERGAAALYASRIIWAAVCLLFLVITAAVIVKRVHDRGRSAWWLLAVLALAVPPAIYGSTLPPQPPTPGPALPEAIGMALAVPFFTAAIVVLIECGFRRGTLGENRYGPDPT